MENSKMEIKVVDGRTIRKFVNRMKKMGGEIVADKPNRKSITSGGETIFSALKFSTGWSVLIHPMFISDLKSCLS
jgi:hypothetical protein